MAGRPNMSGSRSASDEPRRSVPAGRRTWAWEPESPPAPRVMHRLVRLAGDGCDCDKQVFLTLFACSVAVGWCAVDRIEKANHAENVAPRRTGPNNTWAATGTRERMLHHVEQDPPGEEGRSPLPSFPPLNNAGGREDGNRGSLRKGCDARRSWRLVHGRSLRFYYAGWLRQLRQ